MKRKIISITGILCMILLVQAQNDTMYVISNGVTIGKHKLTEVDSVVFNKVSSPVETLDVPNSNFLNMAIYAADYIDTNQQIPLLINTDESEYTKVNAAEFYFMMSRWLRVFKQNGEGATPPQSILIIRNIDEPPAPQGVSSGTVAKADILTKGESNANFIETNNYVPNYSTIGSSKFLPQALYYLMAKTIRYYVQNSSTFPATVTITDIPAPGNWNSNTSGTPGSYSWSKTLSVPYTPQPDSHTCGPTSLKMLMDYYETTKTIDEICTYMTSIGDNPNDGVNGSTIINTAKYYGFNAAVDIYGSTFLKNAISNNHPVIAAIIIKANEYPLYYPGGEAVYPSYNGGHYLVVVGLQAASDGSIEYVIVNDPMVSSGVNLRYTWESFDTAWARQNKYMIRLQ